MSVFVLEDELEGFHSFTQHQAFQPPANMQGVASCGRNKCTCNTGRDPFHPTVATFWFATDIKCKWRPFFLIVSSFQNRLFRNPAWHLSHTLYSHMLEAHWLLELLRAERHEMKRHEHAASFKSRQWGGKWLEYNWKLRRRKYKLRKKWLQLIIKRSGWYLMAEEEAESLWTFFSSKFPSERKKKWRVGEIWPTFWEKCALPPSPCIRCCQRSGQFKPKHTQYPP